MHGSYVLPIFHDGRLIGRADLKNHRSEKRLEAKRVCFEPWFVTGARAPGADWAEIDQDAAFAGVAEALRSLATFLAADRVTVGTVDPRKLAPPLKQALVKGSRVEATQPETEPALS